jgi:hypothetical protein
MAILGSNHVHVEVAMSLRRVVVMVLCVVVIAGTVAAGATYMQKLGAAWGRNMTVEQFLSAVDPDMLASTTAKMRATVVTWAGPAGTTIRASHLADSLSASSQGQGAQLLASLPAITVDYTNNGVWFPQEQPYTVRYAALTTVTRPSHYRVPYMSLEAKLLFDGSTLHQTTVARSNVWQVTAAAGCGIRGPGDYCCVSYHYVEYPSGYSPETSYVVLVSPIETW